jgi:SAM-dependent methyltransferase
MAELFDQYDKNYGDVVGESISFSGLKHDFFMQAKADLIERKLISLGKLSPHSKLSALDIGCGIGTMHPYIRPLFATIDGCDVSAESIERATRENPSTGYRHYEAGSALPYESGTFDFALTVCVVHHVPPIYWPDFFVEMRRVLKPGGLACVIEHNPFNPATRLAVLRCPFDEDAVLLRSGKTHALMRAAGFTNPKSEFFLALPSAKPIARRVEQFISGLPIGAQYASFATA